MFCAFVLLFLFYLDSTFSEEICQFVLGSGQKMDISMIPQLSADLTPCGEKYHSIVFGLCANLKNTTCPSTYTFGPGNGCDEYNGSTSSFYWLGGMKNWTKSNYDTNTKTWSMYYRGLVQTQHSPNWRRDISVSMKCDEREDWKADCQGIEQHQSSTMYKVEVTSKHACPITGPEPPNPHHEGKSSKLNGGEIAGIIVGSLAGTVVLVCGALAAIVIVAIMILLLIGCLVVLAGGICCGGGGLGFLIGSRRGYRKLDEDRVTNVGNELDIVRE